MASIRERKGRFIGLYRDAQGKQKSAGTYDTAEEALARATVAELDANPPETIVALPAAKRGKVTVAGYAPGWLEGHRLEDTSRESYGCLLKHVVAGLGTVPVADLDVATVKRFFRKLEAGKLSPASLARIKTVLSEMCKSAVVEDILAKNPVADVKIAPRRNAEMKIATRAQAKAIRLAVPAHFMLLIEALFETGARYGELMGLGPEHITIKETHAVVHIGRRVVTEVGGKPRVKSYGKSTNATRDIVVPLDLGTRLLEAARDGWIFRAPRGGYLSRSNFRRVWKAACAVAGVPDLRVHDARHSHASWLANDRRVPLAAVRDRLGHASLEVTNRYVHDMTKPEDILCALGAAA